MKKMDDDGANHKMLALPTSKLHIFSMLEKPCRKVSEWISDNDSCLKISRTKGYCWRMESRNFCKTASKSNLRSRVSGFSKTWKLVDSKFSTCCFQIMFPPFYSNQILIPSFHFPNVGSLNVVSKAAVGLSGVFVHIQNQQLVVVHLHHVACRRCCSTLSHCCYVC